MVYLQNVQLANKSFNTTAIPGEHLIELMPFLQYIPGGATKSLSVVKQYKPYVRAVVQKPYAEVKAAMVCSSLL